MNILTTDEALLYIQEQTGKARKPHKTQLNKWQCYIDNDGSPWITPHTRGGAFGSGDQNTYTIAALDELCRKINTNYRKRRNG